MKIKSRLKLLSFAVVLASFPSLVHAAEPVARAREIQVIDIPTADVVDHYGYTCEHAIDTPMCEGRSTRHPPHRCRAGLTTLLEAPSSYSNALSTTRRAPPRRSSFKGCVLGERKFSQRAL